MTNELKRKMEFEPDSSAERALVLSSKVDYERIAPVRKSYIEKFLTKAVGYVPFYSRQKERYTNLKVESLSAFPLTFQDDLLKDPYQFVSKNSRPTQVTSSGGTYGKRKILFRTNEDMEKSVSTAASMFSLTGVRNGDVVAIMQPFDLWNIGHIGMEAFKKLGVLSIPLGLSAKEDEVLDILAFTKAKTLYGTPSRVISLALLSRDKGLVSDIQISKVLCAGEPILGEHRELIRKLWGAEIFGIYGSEETDGIGAECKFHNGYHILDGNSVFEVLDPETLLPAEKNEGVLAVTNVGYTGTALLRYLLGDKVQVDMGECECGETTVKIKPHGRLEETIWLYAGTKVTTKSMEDLMKSVLGKIPLYQIVVEQKNDRDILWLKINSVSNFNLSESLTSGLRELSQDLRGVY